jgi:hypothetical protein
VCGGARTVARARRSGGHRSLSLSRSRARSPYAAPDASPPPALLRARARLLALPAPLAPRAQHVAGFHMIVRVLRHHLGSQGAEGEEVPFQRASGVLHHLAEFSSSAVLAEIEEGRLQGRVFSARGDGDAHGARVRREALALVVALLDALFDALRPDSTATTLGARSTSKS